MMTWEEVRELGPLYAVGALDEETAHKVEDFLRKATLEQQREITGWREVVAMIPLALPTTPVPAHLKGRLMARIAAESQSSETPTDGAATFSTAASDKPSADVLPFTSVPRAESSVRRWLPLAAAVLLSFTTAYLLWQNSKLSGERDRLVHELNDTRGKLNEVVSPATRWIVMQGIEAPQALGKVVWDEKEQVWFIYIYNLPAPPSDKSYQLWYVTKKSPVGITVFNTDTQGRETLVVKLPADVLNESLIMTAVTLEPKGGSPQPTGKFFLKATI